MGANAVRGANTARVDMTITGGAHFVTLDGGHQVTPLSVRDGANVTISNLTIFNGGRMHDGGIRIYADGTATIANCTITGNRGAVGGGILNAGTLRVVNSTISDNVFYQGGAIENFGTLTLIGSKIINNQAQYGGGIRNAGTVTIGSTIFSGNTPQDIVGEIPPYPLSPLPLPVVKPSGPTTSGVQPAAPHPAPLPPSR
jgi:hypothetical protein